MFSKNIKFKNFSQKISAKAKKKINNILKSELIISSSLLNSFSENYRYSFKKENLKKYKKYQSINLIGMGGSILGTEAIYDFLNFKIKKKIKFYNNLKSKIHTKSKKKNFKFSSVKIGQYSRDYI